MSLGMWPSILQSPSSRSIKSPDRSSRRSSLVLPESEIDAPCQCQFGGCCARHDARDSVISKTRLTSEHEDIPRFEHHRLDRLAPLESAKQESSCITYRHGHD